MTKGRAIVLFLQFCGCLPLWANRAFGRFLGWCLWLFPNRSRATTLENLARCFPEKSESERRKLARESLQHTAMTALEMPLVLSKSDDWLNKRILKIHNIEIFNEGVEAEEGMVILLPHLGNWEVYARFIPARAHSMGLYQPPRWDELEDFIKKHREKTGGILVPTNQRGVAKLLKFLRDGGTTCILPDQLPNDKERGGVFSPFFGYPVQTMTLVSQLTQRTGCRVIGSIAKRVPDGFEIMFFPVDDDIYSKDDVVSTTAINKFVEHVARLVPEQYQWEYKRFRRKPKDADKE